MLTDYHLHLRPDDARRDRGRATSPPANAERYRAAAERARDRRAGRLRTHLPLRAGARRLAAPVLARATRTTTSTTTARSCASRPTCGWASRPTSSPAPRTAWPTCSRRATSTTSSARCTSSRDGAVDMDDYSVWDSGAQRRGDLAALLRDDRRGRAQRPVRHPRPPRPREGLGRASARCPRATCAATTSWRSRRSPSRASRSRSRPPGCASRSASSIRRRRSWRCAWRRARRSRSPATPTARGRRRRATSRRSSCSASSACASCACSSAASGAWSRSGDEPRVIAAGIGYDSHRLRRRPAAGPRRRRDPARAAASTATPTPTCSPTP